MKTKVTNVTQCSGGGHVIFDILVNDVTTIKSSIEKTKIRNFVSGLDDGDIFLVHAWEEIKKAGATTPAQMKTALLNKEWEW